MKLFNFASVALAVITGLMSPGETSAAEQGGTDCGIPETVAVKDATKTARDGGTTSNRTCKFTAELPEEKLETPVVHANVSTAFGTINVVRHAAYGERRNLADEGAGYAASAACKAFPAGADAWGDRCNAHETAQNYDVFYPAKVDGRTRVVLFVHGGSYMLNHDAGLVAGAGKEVIGALLAENIVAYSMNYIMPQNLYADAAPLNDPSLARAGATFDAMLKDIDLMMTELRADVTRRFPSQAEDLLGRCVIWGESAGAHLASLYAYDAANPARLGLGLRHDVALRAVVNMAGPVDFGTAESLSCWAKYGNVGLGKKGMEKLARVLSGGRDPALYSSALLVASGATPTVLDYSQGTTVGGIDGDGAIPIQQYQLLRAALDEKRVPYRTILNRGYLHGQELILSYKQAFAAVDELLVSP